MIRIVKARREPAILRKRGKITTAANNKGFDADPEAYRAGRNRFEFDRKLYGAKSVKKALCRAQHDKCAFCEAKISHVYHGDVEHFRPKRAVRNGPNDPALLPGYYWLAYAWDNLFFVCAICNQTEKRNLFPLANPIQRARSHHDDHNAEVTLLIDPVRDDPQQCIGFRKHRAFPIDNDQRARVTIDLLGLNRDALAEHRRTHIEHLTLLRQTLMKLPQNSEEAGDIRNFFERAVLPTAEYSSMTRALLTGALIVTLTRPFAGRAWTRPG